MKDKYIAQAQTEKEAIIKGLNALGISEDEAIITVEKPAKKGFFGIGQQDAVVVVERKEKIDVLDELLSSEINDINIAPDKKTEIKEVKQEEEKGSVKTEVTENTSETAISVKEEPQETIEEATSESEPVAKVAEEKQESAKAAEPKEEKELTEQDIEALDQKAIDGVKAYLKNIILAMDIPDVEVYTSRVENRVQYDIETENAGLVIGRHGKVLNGLQTLAQNHMHQLAYSKINVRVDAEKYRERRKNTVDNLAERTADKVIKTNRPVKLDPMPAHERKQIHHQLNKNPKVKTHSEGREPKRYLVVEPND